MPGDARTTLAPASLPSADQITGTLSPREQAELRRASGSWLTLVLVVVSLIVALLVPRLAQGRIDRLRSEINEIAEPARGQVADIVLDLAIEGSARRGYLLTGDSILARRFADARARRRISEQQVLAYARQLERPGISELTGPALRLEALDRGLDSLLASGVARAQRLGEVLPEEQQRFATIEGLADSLGKRIEAAADERRQAIATIEGDVRLLTAALVLLGLGAALLVARLGGRFRALALRLELSETRERQARLAAEQRRRELERVTESRTRLMRGFTHDVKNPLGAADGFLELLEDGVMGGLSEKQRDTVARVRRAIRQALDLIAQLLEIARAEAGQLEIRKRETDLAALVREVADAFAPQARGKALELREELPPRLPALQTDPARVRQIVGNLISNAVKYTPARGHVVVRGDARCDDGAPAPREVAIIVVDDGPGIPADKLPRLFEEFTRLDPGAAEGAGIGLAISQRIAHALGGEITVESRDGQGSAFTLHLPCSVPAQDG